MRKARPRPPEVLICIAAAEKLWGWAARARRSVTGRRPYGALSGLSAPLSEAFKRRGWIALSRGVLLGPLRDLADPGILAQASL